MHHILCESPFISRDFYAIRPLILWHILGSYFLLIWGVGVVRIIFTSKKSLVRPPSRRTPCGQGQFCPAIVLVGWAGGVLVVGRLEVLAVGRLGGGSRVFATQFRKEKSTYSASTINYRPTKIIWTINLVIHYRSITEINFQKLIIWLLPFLAGNCCWVFFVRLSRSTATTERYSQGYRPYRE